MERLRPAPACRGVAEFSAAPRLALQPRPISGLTLSWGTPVQHITSPLALVPPPPIRSLTLSHPPAAAIPHPMASRRPSGGPPACEGQMRAPSGQAA
mmetsp:Transcript_101335/g.175001  ORF Transcript_101335/g.175001 Transcript_101335/m.175001 type:complete len:97 (-) Transcript_101335:30-320(-)